MEMIERMAVVETEIKLVKEDVEDIKEMLTNHIDREDRKYEYIKKNYAGKWVEKFSVAVILAVIAAFFSFIEKYI